MFNKKLKQELARALTRIESLENIFEGAVRAKAKYKVNNIICYIYYTSFGPVEKISVIQKISGRDSPFYKLANGDGINESQILHKCKCDPPKKKRKKK